MTPPPFSSSQDEAHSARRGSEAAAEKGGGMSAVRAISGVVIKEIFRKKDFYVAFILIAAILFYAASLRFYNVANTVMYLIEIGLMLIFLFSVILAVSLAARQYPSEAQSRTCQVLLAKPVSRIEYILGKFLGSFAAGLAAFAIFFFAFLAVILGRQAFFSAPVAGQAFYLFTLNLLVVTAMASAFSYYFTVSANVTISLAVYFLINTYGAGLKEASLKLFWLNRGLGEAMYYLLPHFEFFDMRQRFIHGWEPLSAPLVFFLTLYAVFYAAAFLFLAWLGFRRRTV